MNRGHIWAGWNIPVDSSISVIFCTTWCRCSNGYQNIRSKIIWPVICRRASPLLWCTYRKVRKFSQWFTFSSIIHWIVITENHRYGVWFAGWRNTKFWSLYGILSDNCLFSVRHVTPYIGGHIVRHQFDDIECGADVHESAVQLRSIGSGYGNSVRMRSLAGTTQHSSTTNFLSSPAVWYKMVQIGWFQISMSFFRLGNLSSLLSDPLVNGFTTGAAVHVTVSQLKDLFGIKIPRHKGAFKIIKVSERHPWFFTFSFSIMKSQQKFFTSFPRFFFE